MSTAEEDRLRGRNGEIWDAYTAGVTQERIAAKYGISQQRTSQIIAEVRESVPARDKGSEAMRSAEVLDRLRVAYLDDALAGNTAAAGAYLAADKRKAALLGLDAPSKVDVHADVAARDASYSAAVRGVLVPVLEAVLAAVACPYAQRGAFADYGEAMADYLLSGRQGDLPVPPVLEAEEVHVELLPTTTPQVQAPRFPTLDEARAMLWGDDAQA